MIGFLIQKLGKVFIFVCIIVITLLFYEDKIIFVNDIDKLIFEKASKMSGK